MVEAIMLEQSSMGIIMEPTLETDQEENTTDDIQQEIECPRSNDLMILCSEFDSLCYYCEECDFMLYTKKGS